MIRDCRQAERIEGFIDLGHIVALALDEILHDEVGLAAVRQRITSALEQPLRLVEREL